MKNVKKALVCAVAASLIASSQVFALDSSGSAPVPSDMQSSWGGLSMETESAVPANQPEDKFGRVSGKVLSVYKAENDGSVEYRDDEGNKVDGPFIDWSYVLVETADGGNVNLIVDSETIYLGDKEVAEGDEVTGFYDMNRPALMIYPPQYQAIVLSVDSEVDGSVFFGSFDENLVSNSTDMGLKINISEDTEIIHGDSIEFNEASVEEKTEFLKNKRLIVLYTVTTRSIPPQTTPSVVVVVPYSSAIMPLEEPETGNELTEDGEFGSVLVLPDTGYLENIADYPIIVKGNAIDGAAYLKDGIVMVPLRAISEALGFKVLWNASVRSVSVGDNATVVIDADNNQLGAAAEIVDGSTYVPLNFFTNVMLVNNAYVFEGQIVVDSQEKME